MKTRILLIALFVIFTSVFTLDAQAAPSPTTTEQTTEESEGNLVIIIALSILLGVPTIFGIWKYGDNLIDWAKRKIEEKEQERKEAENERFRVSGFNDSSRSEYHSLQEFFNNHEMSESQKNTMKVEFEKIEEVMDEMPGLISELKGFKEDLSVLENSLRKQEEARDRYKNEGHTDSAAIAEEKLSINEASRDKCESLIQKLELSIEKRREVILEIMKYIQDIKKGIELNEDFDRISNESKGVNEKLAEKAEKLASNLSDDETEEKLKSVKKKSKNLKKAREQKSND